MRKKIKIEIRKAALKDVREIHKLVNGFSKKGLMLARPISYIETRIRDFFVCVCDGRVVGCAGLKVWNREWAEVNALAVHLKYQGNGIGLKLTKKCIQDAKKIGIKYLLMLTFQHNLAQNAGFIKMGSIKKLPEIVFTEKIINADKAYLMEIGKD
ncbi:MAG: GNAT family N-acetyltransferase [Candidatus Portnoybacteria bacterium]|nr:GNAT family N-acetyltransferase [Candidatus Portnoybacteria bacterium]